MPRITGHRFDEVIVRNTVKKKRGWLTARFRKDVLYSLWRVRNTTWSNMSLHAKCWHWTLKQSSCTSTFMGNQAVSRSKNRLLIKHHFSPRYRAWLLTTLTWNIVSEDKTCCLNDSQQTIYLTRWSSHGYHGKCCCIQTPAFTVSFLSVSHTRSVVVCIKVSLK